MKKTILVAILLGVSTASNAFGDRDRAGHFNRYDDFNEKKVVIERKGAHVFALISKSSSEIASLSSSNTSLQNKIGVLSSRERDLMSVRSDLLIDLKQWESIARYDTRYITFLQMIGRDISLVDRQLGMVRSAISKYKKELEDEKRKQEMEKDKNRDLVGEQGRGYGGFLDMPARKRGLNLTQDQRDWGGFMKMHEEIKRNESKGIRYKSEDAGAYGRFKF